MVLIQLIEAVIHRVTIASTGPDNKQHVGDDGSHKCCFTGQTNWSAVNQDVVIVTSRLSSRQTLLKSPTPHQLHNFALIGQGWQQIETRLYPHWLLDPVSNEVRVSAIELLSITQASAQFRFPEISILN